MLLEKLVEQELKKESSFSLKLKLINKFLKIFYQCRINVFRLFVTGRVQGVFFRQSLKAKSIQNNIFGWVKNLQDGRVECILEGTEENISILVTMGSYWSCKCNS